MVGAVRDVLGRTVVRNLVIAALCLAGVVIYFNTVAEQYPVKDWLFWRMLVLWSWCGLFQLACVSMGHLVLTRVLKMDDLPTLEKLVASMTIGVVAFTIAMYVGGALALYRPWFAIALPIAMFLPGAPALWRLAASWRQRALATPPLRLGPWATAAIVGGVLCLALLYLESMTPAALNYDSRWYHITVAQDYAREGRIVRFPADINKAFPQLASFIFTWDWLLPGLNVSLRCMLALHSEFFLFVWTLAGVAAVVAWMADRARVPGAWAAFFLFPSIFVYDSNIGGSADHVLAFFTPLIFLAAVRAAQDLSPRRCALLGCAAAGAVLTKYQALYMLAPVTVLLAGGWLVLLLRKRPADRRQLWLGPATLLAVGVALTLPHFLKNAIYYHNPFFPFAISTFKGTTPNQPGLAEMLGMYVSDPAIPRGTAAEVVRSTWNNIRTFFFNRPYSFGLIFPLILPLVPFVRGGRRLWITTGVALGGFVVWAFTYAVERYLQAVVPMFAAVTAGVVMFAWRQGWLARAGVLALVATQIVWGGDALFYSGFGRLDDAISMIRSGSEGRAKHRFDPYLASQVALSQSLPSNAVVLFHNTRLSLGVNRPTLQDLPGYQGLISYRGVKTARELIEMYRSFGITHMAHERGAWPTLSKQEEVVIGAFLARYARNISHHGEYEVVELPAELPPVEAPYRVLTLGINGYADGVYPVEALNVIDPLPERMKHYPPPAIPAPEGSPESLAALDTVDVVLATSQHPLSPAISAILGQRFVNAVSYFDRAHFAVYVRKVF